MAREECALGPSFSVPIPNALLNAASMLKGRVETRLFDAVLEKADFARVERLLDEYKPDAVVTTILNYTIRYEARIADLCAARGIRCVAIPMPIHYHERVARAGGFHFVTWREPEETILDWALGAPRESLAGAMFIRNGELVRNASRDPFFDKLPVMDWSLIPDAGRYGWVLYQVSRNCKWGCLFCMWAAGAPRFKSVDVVIADLAWLKRHARGNPGILTASITQQKDWFHSFTEKAAGLKIRFSTDIRADETEREDLVALKRAGCARVLIGVESLSQRLLDSLNKRETVERNMRVICWCNELGIATDAILMFNIGETDEDVEQYVRRVFQCSPTRATPVIYKYMEGTRPAAPLPMEERFFWGTEPMKTPVGVDKALERVARFRKKTRFLKFRLLWWSIRHPGQWSALLEDIRSRLRSRPE